MIGRGAQGQPWLLAQAGDLLAGRAIRPDLDIAQRHQLMRLHLDDMLSHYGDNAMRLARKHIAWYASGLPGAARSCVTSPITALMPVPSLMLLTPFHRP